MASEVVLKEAGPQWTVSLREIIPGFRSVGVLAGNLREDFGPLASEGMWMSLWHDREHKDQNIDIEVAVCLRQAVDMPPPVDVRQLPSTTVASVVHHGAFVRIGEAYQALLHWIEANQYHPSGAPRNLYLRVNMPVNHEDESNVTEIQIPVEKS